MIFLANRENPGCMTECTLPPFLSDSPKLFMLTATIMDHTQHTLAASIFSDAIVHHGYTLVDDPQVPPIPESPRMHPDSLPYLKTHDTVRPPSSTLHHDSTADPIAEELREYQRTPTHFEDAVEVILSEFVILFLGKHADYGPGNIMDSALQELLAGTEYASQAVEWGVLQRLGDKYHRLINLYKGSATPNNESLDDSWDDVMGYALVALLVRRGWFGLPMDLHEDTIHDQE